MPCPDCRRMIIARSIPMPPLHWRGRRIGPAPGGSYSLVDPRAIRSDGGRRSHGRDGSKTDRAYGRSKLAAERGWPSLTLTGSRSGRARLRARREGQHGGTPSACALAVSAAARRPFGEALAALARQPGGSHRHGPSRKPAQAAFHCRRPATADGSRDDHGNAPRRRPPPRARSACRRVCSKRRSARRDGRRLIDA